MLQSLHVKNLALIKETEVEFGEGLNILTGETGAGKSLLIGSVTLALGGKFDKEMLRKGADSALVELVFSGTGENIAGKLAELGLDSEDDGTVIISRKLQAGKSVCKINGETVTAKQVKELAELLIDIHGQHEHQSLLHKKKHMEILDGFCGKEFQEAARLAEEAYRECRDLRRGLDENYQFTGGDFENGAANALSRALRALRCVTVYDGRLQELEGQLSEIDDLLADYNRDLAEYMAGCEFDGEDFAAVEERLNTLNRLKDKYGNSKRATAANGTIEAVIAYGEERQRLLDKLEDYDAYMQDLQDKLAISEKRLEEACGRLSAIRQKNALILGEKIRSALVNLNFQTVEFAVEVRPGQAVTARGSDDVEFMISTNPGESLKPLGQVASGGELSRVMLAIKTVLAGQETIGTLIFDEIDAGISGRTAWKVSEQLDTVAHSTQVLCITHLPQIAAMADSHFAIEKSSTEDNTITDIRRLSGEEGLGELARLLGSDALTEAALSNAREMRAQAEAHKKEAGKAGAHSRGQ